MTNVKTLSAADYEDYNTVSGTYDNWRRPVALESLYKALEVVAEGTGVEKRSLKLLDVGCGTGNYIDALKDKVGSCTGLEYNPGMLSKAMAKHKGNDSVELLQCSAFDMDTIFDPETFDVVIITQVLHHMTMEMQNQVLANVQKVLKKKGVLWVSTLTPIQAMEGFWFSPLIPQAAALLGSRIPGIPLLQQIISKAGLTVTDIEVPKDTMMPLDKLMDINGPFSEQYRRGDSSWSLATPEELEAGLAWWKEQINLGVAEAFFKERAQRQAEVGQSTTIICIKE